MWRRSGERFQDAYMSKHDRYGGCSIIVWAGISRGGRTYPPIVIKGMQTGLCYMDDIMDVHVRPTLVQSESVHLYGRLRSISSCTSGWLRRTSSRRPKSIWTGQHAHLISTRSSMFGTCYMWLFCDIQSNQRLSSNWEMSSLKSGTIHDMAVI